MLDPVGFACRCCGVPVHGEIREKLRVCPLCDQCDGKHGDALQAHCVALVEQGRTTWGTAIARLAIDNAHLWGTLEWHGDPRCAELHVAHCPSPWQTLVGRCAARGVMPGYDALLNACLAPFVPGPNTHENKQAIADELTTALCWLDQNVASVDVGFEADTFDAAHILIRVNLKQAVPGAIMLETPGADIPRDIMARPRGQA